MFFSAFKSRTFIADGSDTNQQSVPIPKIKQLKNRNKNFALGVGKTLKR